VSVARSDITRIIGGMVGVIVVILAVALPAAYFAIGWQSQDRHLRTSTEIYARQVSTLINRNPTMWRYETIRFEGILSSQPGEKHLESSRILDLDGIVVVRQEESLRWPVMTRSQPLWDSGMIAGSLETSASLRPLIAETAVVALVGSVLGLALFFLLRAFPISALNNALHLLSREMGRAKVTLDSIGDAVISTDSEDRVLLVNRAAENMTGWPQAEATGRPVGEVFRREGDVLVGRDGSRRLIEAGTSPILDESGRP